MVLEYIITFSLHIYCIHKQCMREFKLYLIVCILLYTIPQYNTSVIFEFFPIPKTCKKGFKIFLFIYTAISAILQSIMTYLYKLRKIVLYFTGSSPSFDTAKPVLSRSSNVSLCFDLKDTVTIRNVYWAKWLALMPSFPQIITHVWFFFIILSFKKKI